MKKAFCIGILLCVLAFNAYVQAQQATPQKPVLKISATEVKVDGKVTHMVGRVIISVGDTLIEADEADFHSDTSEFDLRGHVVVRSPFQGTMQAERMLFRLPKSEP